MDVDAFTIFGFAFFIFVMFWGVNLENQRADRAERIERDRHNRDINERREFGYDQVQDRRNSEKSFRRFLK